MILHLVIFTLHPGVDREDPRLQTLHADMLMLPDLVPGILEWHTGFNATPDAEAGDYAVSARFADSGALFTYFDHPAHQALLPRWDDVAELRFVDLEF